MQTTLSMIKSRVEMLVTSVKMKFSVNCHGMNLECSKSVIFFFIFIITLFFALFLQSRFSNI